MVQSKLDKSINYQEIKYMNKDTRKYFQSLYKLNDAITYDIRLFGELIEITFGIKNENFLDKEVVYYPIYLVINDVMSYQIGIYELFLKDLQNNLDETNNLIFDNLEHALFFFYV